MTDRIKRIALFGAESTGKSVLAEALANHFGEPWAPEYVRGFWDAHDGKIIGSDLDAIARGQVAVEEVAASEAKRLVFCDTELLTNVLWADLLFPGQCPPWVREEAERRCQRYALYLLCDTDIPFVEDPQRAFPDAAGREMCRRLWRRTLEERNLPFVEVRGGWSERTAEAIAAVEALLGAAAK
jgi:NadR type nicotinamide-nucleotide adenylyltransferase